MPGFREQLEGVLRTAKGERVLEEAKRLARDPVSKQRIDDLHRKLTGTAPPPPAASTPPRD